MSHQPSAAQVTGMINRWRHDAARQDAQELMQRYGAPQEITPWRAIWRQAGPWKRTMIVDEAVPHDLPEPHEDHLYQWITYEVPADKADDLLMFHPGILIDIPRQDLGCRCRSERANMLAINLAHEIITGQRTWEQAIEFLRDAVLKNRYPEYMEQFQFAVAVPA